MTQVSYWTQRASARKLLGDMAECAIDAWLRRERDIVVIATVRRPMLVIVATAA